MTTDHILPTAARHTGTINEGTLAYYFEISEYEVNKYGTSNNLMTMDISNHPCT
jgi:hypothetical protein